MKNLERLVRLHKAELDSKRAALGMLERQRAEIVAKIDALKRDHEVERGIAGKTLEGMLAYPAYASGIRHRRTAFELGIAALDRDIAAARGEVLTAFAELKRFELTIERKRDMMRREATRLDQTKQNELGLVMFRRRETT